MTTDLEDLLHGYLKMKTSFRGSIFTEKVTTSDFKEDLYSQACKYKLTNCSLDWPQQLDIYGPASPFMILISFNRSEKSFGNQKNRDKKISAEKVFYFGANGFYSLNDFIWEAASPLEMIDGGGIRTQTLVQLPKLKKLGRPESQENCTCWLFWGSEQP